MMRERLLLGPALALILLASAALAGPVAAQSLEDQVDEAASKATGVAEQGAENPEGLAENASDPSWQGQQVNWTRTWSCASAYAVDEDVGETVGEQADCPPPRNEQAGVEEEDEDDPQPQAEAEEAEADAERALRDEIAAAQAFIEATTEDPEQAPSHLQTFVDRTLIFLNRTVEIVEQLLSLPLSGAAYAGQGFLSATSATGQAAQAVAGAIGDGFKVTGEGLFAVAHDLGHLVASSAYAVQDGIVEGAQAIATGAQAGVQAGLQASQAGVDQLQSGWDHLARAAGWGQEQAPTSNPVDDPEDELDLTEQPLDEELPLEVESDGT